MSEVSPSGDPTPSPPPDPGPWAAPDPGPWAAPDPGMAPAGYGPPTPAPPHPTPPSGWAPSGVVPPGASSPYGHPWPYAQPPPPPGRAARRPGATGALIAGAVVLVLVICGALGVTALLRYADAPSPDDPIAQQPYPEPYYSEDGEDGSEPWAARPALTPSDGPGTVRVRYEVTGRGPVDLEYYDANGDFVQAAEVPLPWRLTLRTRDGSRLMVLAHTSDGQAPLTCRITVDGATVDRASATGWGTSCFG